MEKLEAMILEAPSAINFTVFLNMLADKLHGKYLWKLRYLCPTNAPCAKKYLPAPVSNVLK